MSDVETPQMSPYKILRAIEDYVASIVPAEGFGSKEWAKVEDDEIASDPAGVAHALWVAVLSIVHMEVRRGWDPAGD